MPKRPLLADSPSETRAERIARSEAWSRTLNERDSEEVGGRGAVASFRCECWQEECTKRVPLSGEEWRMIRAERNRFAVAPGHVAENFEAVIKEFRHFWMVEKFGEAGEVAEELASSD